MIVSSPCPHCGGEIRRYANPVPTVDVVIHDPERGIVIIQRKNPPHGYALPGGFVDAGESVEHAARREMLEETHLKVTLTGLLGVYSRPDRDPRLHTVSIVFIGRPENPEELCAGDDAGHAAFYPPENLPEPLAFDHAEILADFRAVLAGKRPVGAVYAG